MVNWKLTAVNGLQTQHPKQRSLCMLSLIDKLRIKLEMITYVSYQNCNTWKPLTTQTSLSRSIEREDTLLKGFQSTHLFSIITVKHQRSSYPWCPKNSHQCLLGSTLASTFKLCAGMTTLSVSLMAARSSEVLSTQTNHTPINTFNAAPHN